MSETRRWRAGLDALAPGIRAGLVWKGNLQHHNDAYRSLPSFDGQTTLHLGSELAGLADSAAIVVQLDLLIYVDTAIAHVAGSVGTPCWVLLPAQDINGRWMHGREDSPWYPGVQLFRQAEQGRWGGVVERLMGTLGVAG